MIKKSQIVLQRVLEPVYIKYNVPKKKRGKTTKTNHCIKFKKTVNYSKIVKCAKYVNKLKLNLESRKINRVLSSVILCRCRVVLRCGGSILGWQ